MEPKIKQTFLKIKNKLFQTNEEEIHNWIFSLFKKNFFSIPISVRVISFSLFLFILWWWLGADTYFSLYIQGIVDNVLLLSLIGALLPFCKMIVSLPIGEMNEHGNMKQLLFISKIIYIFAGFFYFFAGFFHLPILLVFAVILNGFASATMFTTYESYIHLVNHAPDTEQSRWLYFSSMNAAYVIGALLSVIIIPWIDLPYLYLFIVVFWIFSLFTDKKIPIHKKQHLKKLFAKESFLHQFIREVFSFKPLKKAYFAVLGYSRSMIYALGFEVLFNIMAYIGFIFIPLVAAKNNLWLVSIALIFALMRLPYVSNFFTTGRIDRYDKKTFIVIVLLFLSFLFASFGFNESLGSIMIISFAISFGLSFMRPVISGLISDYTHPKDAWTIAGVQQFAAMLGSIIGILGFGGFSGIIGIQNTFLLIGIGLFVFAIRWIGKKMKRKIDPY